MIKEYRVWTKYDDVFTVVGLSDDGNWYRNGIEKKLINLM